MTFRLKYLSGNHLPGSERKTERTKSQKERKCSTTKKIILTKIKNSLQELENQGDTKAKIEQQ